MISLYSRAGQALAIGVVLVAGAIGAAVALLLAGDETTTVEGPAPHVVIQKEAPHAAEDLGFPAFATKNTTRVAGPDPISDAAGVALAVYPSTGGIEGPAAVSMVEQDDWTSGVVAAQFAAAPVRAPILLSESDGVPQLTLDALQALAPQGSAATDDKQVLRFGRAAVPTGVRYEPVRGANPAEVADEADRLRQKLTGAGPQHILLASSDHAAFAMPAAAWAARSGDPVLFLQKESAPKPTLEAIARHPGVPVYVLGPTSVISDHALEQVRQVAPDAARVAGEDPVANAIAFARYVDGSFGWNINDPGHGFVVANAARPLDAAAAAPLSSSGDWGPLLLTDDADVVPSPLRGYLLDVKPGYQDDPTRAVYNHIWLMGDASAISVPFQSQIDDLAELVPIRSGTGAAQFGAPPGTG